MLNPTLHTHRLFPEQVKKYLGFYYSIKTMTTIKKNLMKNNTYFMALIMIYENNGKYTRTVYIVLSFVVYTLIDNYVCI